ncbi:hypothetical protein O3G_MSEX003670 [Manduca sexta]|uniref:Uncharacterized protein n=1 Tax=Manduca sexta TaxID=7130 RepID=A0A921YTG5_MANSE|nr:hypothetical protein O3G_MSEX003670 [Manduca sexta]
MAPKKRSFYSKRSPSPLLLHKDPSLSTSLPSTSRDQRLPANRSEPEPPCMDRCLKFLYNRQKKTFCGRTCKSWICIILYSIMYLIFLSTFTLIFLYGSLKIMKHTLDYQSIDKEQLLTYGERGVGLTATPTSETNYPLIWYRENKEEDYLKYVHAIDNLLYNYRKKRDVNSLGVCGQSPYGYGDTPCVLIRINKQWRWAGKPLEIDSVKAKSAPREVQEWMRQDKKLWLQCGGSNSYDKEHIGRIKYYPDPPGFDPSLFPMDLDDTSPLVAMQLTNFTVGLSLAIECKLWYDKGPSSVEFVVYVAPEEVVSNKTSSSV